MFYIGYNQGFIQTIVNVASAKSISDMNLVRGGSWFITFGAINHQIGAHVKLSRVPDKNNESLGYKRHIFRKTLAPKQKEYFLVRKSQAKMSEGKLKKT